MKILALEFSSNRRSVAIADGSDVLARVETDDVKKPPLTLIDEALKNAKLDPAAIETLALGIGPGSYTGIRSAIATAQGWQLARNINLLAIGSAEVLAATARTNGHHGEAHFLIDAQRHEYYHTTWNLTEDNQSKTTPLHIITVTAAAELKAFGPDAAG
ncbi:MAG TPA: tRNA (adenosine(37)-N6)-threonylcarbamoyltransferase complex dimerization subunit type 1 TsaB, partial [Verrucomicrobiales bacterium]|nr:tRNA (adenosine(37)-N6)-threonylcarbamoyltransferase complex dimerization subunit type 1 TsaB [Verrucomicrobiales bacterium]